MDEVRCPMCGKSNPAEAEVCLYCEARLKPLVISPADSEGDQNVPDWLQSLRGAIQPEEEPLEGEEPTDELDWFASQEERQAFETSAPTQDSPTVEEPIDWLAELTGKEAGLTGNNEGESLPENLVEPAGAEEASSLSEWLSNLTIQEEAAGQQESIAEEQPLPLEDTAVPPPLEPTGGEEEMSFSDWLAAASSEELPTLEEASHISEPELAKLPETPEIAEPVEPGELPDWLNELVGNGIPEAIQEPITSEPEEISEAVPVQAEPEEAEIVGTDLPAAPAEIVPELPEWLTQIDRTQESATSSVPAFTPDALEELEPAEQAALEEAAAEALSVPDWISELSTETPDGASEGGMPADREASLAQANLPDWLEAMRPVEAVALEPAFLDRADDHIENAGPLAGLRGIIPGESGKPEQHKPPAYAVKVPISDDQQARLAKLQELLDAEGQEKPLAARAVRTNQLLLRLAVFFLLVLASIFALWQGVQTPLPSSEQISPEVAAAKQHIDALLANQPVLFVLDYEPGYADEMSTMVLPVLDHLIGRGVHLAFVSTSTTGPIIAGNLVNWINGQPAYSNGGFTNYTNLGFLPGGTNGIRTFALAPAQTLPARFDGTPAWTGALAGVQQGLDQFAAVIVAGDDPEGARQWIEQLGPLLKGKTPLILLTSAQAGPLVQPYYASQGGLVSGMVSGMAGGAEYYRITTLASPVPLYWDAFSLALNVIVLFIVLGGFISLITGSFTQRKAQKGEESK
ncbi:MAG: hypothetical protein MUC85_01240 [Anaerolineales bacterium]|jgi:hypothetical protein|nr:hypothetical protein [Anaerolineales bacterium]